MVWAERHHCSRMRGRRDHRRWRTWSHLTRDEDRRWGLDDGDITDEGASASRPHEGEGLERWCAAAFSHLSCVLLQVLHVVVVEQLCIEIRRQVRGRRRGRLEGSRRKSAGRDQCGIWEALEIWQRRLNLHCLLKRQDRYHVALFLFFVRQWHGRDANVWDVPRDAVVDGGAPDVRHEVALIVIARPSPPPSPPRPGLVPHLPETAGKVQCLLRLPPVPLQGGHAAEADGVGASAPEAVTQQVQQSGADSGPVVVAALRQGVDDQLQGDEADVTTPRAVRAGHLAKGHGGVRDDGAFAAGGVRDCLAEVEDEGGVGGSLLQVPCSEAGLVQRLLLHAVLFQELESLPQVREDVVVVVALLDGDSVQELPGPSWATVEERLP